MELYFLEDYSLGEISETFDVSRQAVYDNIRRTETMLEEYEKKLHLYEKFQERQQVLRDMETELEAGKYPEQFSRWVTQLQELE